MIGGRRRPGPAFGSGPGSRLNKSALCTGIRSGATAGNCWRVAGDDSSFSAETVVAAFVCLGSDYLRGGRVSRRMGGNSFPPDVLSNLATCYHRARRVTSSCRFPPPWSVEETDACFIVNDARRGKADRRKHRQAAGAVASTLRVAFPYQSSRNGSAAGYCVPYPNFSITLRASAPFKNVTNASAAGLPTPLRSRTASCRMAL
jgi:hypothetical protein